MEKQDKWSILVKPTHECNLNCKYCYDKPKRDEYGNLRMTYEILDKTLRLCSDHAKEVCLIWHGGEPTLMGTDWYIKGQELIYKYYGTMFEQHMQTNGVLLDESWARLSRDYKIRMGMSFDVLSQDVRQGTGSADLLHKPDIFKRYGLSIGTITVINSQNYKRQIEIYDVLKQSGFSGAAFNHIYRTEGSYKNKLEIDVDDYIKEFARLFKHVVYDMSQDAVEERSVFEAVKSVIGNRDVCCTYSDCRHGWLGVNPNGDVYPCDRYVPDKYYLGNIAEFDSVHDLYETKGFKNYFNDIEKRLETHCSKCCYFRFCMGGCNANHIAVSGSGSGLDVTSCETFKRRFNLAYDILRDMDLFRTNIHLQKLILTHPAFTVKEISLYLAGKGYSAEKIFSNPGIRDMGPGLFELDEYKLFRIFNEYKGEVNCHRDCHSFPVNYKMGDRVHIVKDRLQIMDRLYEENKVKIDNIAGGR